MCEVLAGFNLFGLIVGSYKFGNEGKIFHGHLNDFQIFKNELLTLLLMTSVLQAFDLKADNHVFRKLPAFMKASTTSQFAHSTFSYYCGITHSPEHPSLLLRGPIQYQPLSHTYVPQMISSFFPSYSPCFQRLGS
jgi:hypothetical protein